MDLKQILSLEDYQEEINYIKDAGFEIDYEAQDMIKSYIYSHDKQVLEAVSDILDVKMRIQNQTEDYGGKEFSPIGEKKGYITALQEVANIITKALEI